MKEDACALGGHVGQPPPPRRSASRGFNRESFAQETDERPVLIDRGMGHIRFVLLALKGFAH